MRGNCCMLHVNNKVFRYTLFYREYFITVFLNRNDKRTLFDASGNKEWSVTLLIRKYRSDLIDFKGCIILNGMVKSQKLDRYTWNTIITGEHFGPSETGNSCQNFH